MSNHPIFLVAPVRSGSTLLHLMLNSHPNISNPGECDFLFDLVKESGEHPGLENYLDKMQTSRYFQAMNITVEPAQDYAQQVASFVRKMQKGKQDIVMNVHHEFYKIPSVFPSARYIHLIRDGRDVARSCMAMGWAGNPYYGIDIWLEAEMAWDRLKSMLKPDQYMEIKYEDLLCDVEKGLTDICRFVGVEYSPSMMDYAKNSTYAPPDKSLCFQWKRKYGKRDLSLAEYKAGNMLLDRGYELSGVKIAGPGLFERIGLFIQNKWHRARWQVGMYGLPLFIKHFLVQKIGHTQWERMLSTDVNAAVNKTLK